MGDQSFSLLHQMLPHANFASNHLLCKHQLKTGWLSSTLRDAQALWPSSPPSQHPQQLNGLLNLMFLAFSNGSPSLSDCLLKNKTASPSARTTSSVIHSSRQTWNMSAISDPLHAWEGGGWSPLPSLKVTMM